MGTLTLRCTCGKTMSVPDEHRGAKIKCRQCGVVMRVPPAAGVNPPPRQPSPQAAGRVWTLHNVGLLFAGIGRWLVTRVPRRSGSRTRVNWRRLIAPSAAAVVSRLAWTYLVAVCVVALVLWQSGDAWWPATVLLFIGRWVFLIPCVLLVAVAALTNRRALAPLCLAAVIVLVPVMGARVGWQRMIPHPAGLHVRVVSMNVEGGEKNWVRLADFLEMWRPDVLAIQECGTPMAAAVDALKGWYVHHSSDLCVVSRFPIADSSVMNRGTLARIHGENDEGIGGAGYVARYVLQTPRGPVSLTNLHLETPRKGLENLLGSIFDSDRLTANTELRGIESQLARQWVDKGAAPTIIVGDFNTPVESQIFQHAWGDFTDAFSHAGFGLGMTKYNGWIRVRIDHVLTGPGWYADRVAVGEDIASDHRPVIVDLTLVPAEAPARSASAAP